MRTFWFLVLLACNNDPKSPDTAETETDTDTDTDSDTDTDADADTDTDTDTDAPLTSWDPADFSTVIDVGPGKAYAEIEDVPWETLSASTLVRIWWREEPYRSKFVVTAAGTEDEPVVITGMPSDGRLPVVTGDGAVTRLELDYWNEERSVIKVGGASTPSGTPAHVIIAYLDVRSGRPGYSFTSDAGASSGFNDNAASVHIEDGEHITVLGCTLRDSGNGLFVSSGARDVLIYGNHLYDNGIEGSFYEHNSYTEALGITFEANHYGLLREGCDGNNLKDRSAGTVVRYNLIEGGNRALDLVETGSADLAGDPRYAETFVYGNVFIERDDSGNSQILHYGGDGDGVYRGGTLYLYSNTIVSYRSGNTTLVRLSTAGEHADIRNNVIVGSPMAIISGDGTAELADNWLNEGWSDAFSGGGAVSDGGNLSGDAAGLDGYYHPTSSSPFLGQAGEPHPGTAGHPVQASYSDQGTVSRADLDDMGAFAD